MTRYNSLVKIKFKIRTLKEREILFNSDVPNGTPKLQNIFQSHVKNPSAPTSVSLSVLN